MQAWDDAVATVESVDTRLIRDREFEQPRPLHNRFTAQDVLPERRRQGIGAALVAAFETGAATIVVERVSVASAGGYVDRFYAAQGDEPWAVLVRTPADGPGDQPDPQYDILKAGVEHGVRTRYADPEGVDFGFADGWERPLATTGRCSSCRNCSHGERDQPSRHGSNIQDARTQLPDA